MTDITCTVTAARPTHTYKTMTIFYITVTLSAAAAARERNVGNTFMMMISQVHGRKENARMRKRERERIFKLRRRPANDLSARSTKETSWVSFSFFCDEPSFERTSVTM